MQRREETLRREHQVGADRGWQLFRLAGWRGIDGGFQRQPQYVPFPCPNAELTAGIGDCRGRGRNELESRSDQSVCLWNVAVEEGSRRSRIQGTKGGLSAGG